MKLLVVLAVAACAVAAPQYGYTYSAFAPLVSPYQPYSYYGPYSTPFAYQHMVNTPVVVSDAAPVVVKDAAPTPVIAPVVVKHQYHMQNELGQARFGFSEPNHAQDNTRDAAGNMVGSFSYVNPDGKVVRTDYIADAMGYRVASNDLPSGPVDSPTPVEDTLEVKEAKAKFFEEFEKTKSRARRSVPVMTPASTTPLDTSVVAPVVTKAIIPSVAPITPYTYPYMAPLAYNAPINPFYNYYHSYPYYARFF